MNRFTNLPPEEFGSLRPRVAADVRTRNYDDGIVAWSPACPRPTPLDGVSAVAFQILDGSGTVAELIMDIHDVVGIPESIARSQLQLVLDQFASFGLLEGSEPAEEHSAEIDLFPAPPNP